MVFILEGGDLTDATLGEHHSRGFWQRTRADASGQLWYEMSPRGSNKWMATVKYRFNPRRGYEYTFPGWGKPWNPPAAPAEAERAQSPENPGIRIEAFSTYGVAIPLSIGQRRISGNVIDATPLTPRLEGERYYTTKVRVPIIPVEEIGPS